MKKRWLFLLLPLMIPGFLAAQQLTPRQLYGSLFTAVQMSNVFPDNKTFVDCTPKSDPSRIVMEYLGMKDKPGFDLHQFVLDHFNLPPDNSSHYRTDTNETVKAHINELWNVLSRNPDTKIPFSSLLPLPYSYIVPGGRFREIYYWDSYFTMLGLKESGRVHMIEKMVMNFAYLIDKYGFIPNGNRSYYLTRSQPPFFSMMVELLAQIKGRYIYAIYQPALIREYQFWMKGAKSVKPGEMIGQVACMPGGEILNRYWDESNQPREESYREDIMGAKLSPEPAAEYYRNIRAAAESGMDFSSRWFRDGKTLSSIITLEIVPVDLNCLLYHLEKTIARSYEISGNKQLAGIYQDKAQKRQKAIQKYFWNKSLGFYTDYVLRTEKHSVQLTLAGMFPLFFKLASPEQSALVAKTIRNKFLKAGGLVTSLKTTGQQWDAPNGWAPLEYISIEGLDNYPASRNLARAAALNWINLGVKVYGKTGKMLEKYNVEDTSLSAGGGEYPLQDGFGWTNGVMLKLLDQFKISK
ncbi:MAG TPA: alpha,alpha-trehalase TreF [Chitinophagaceae bacterium]|nr:alpha,alpha-trehalase TreF [Chitinophagaceae bacterium]